MYFIQVNFLDITPNLSGQPTHRRTQMSYRTIVVGGTANPALSEAVCKLLGLGATPMKPELRRFADGELFVRYPAPIRGGDVFIIQPTCRGLSQSVNDNIMELLLLIDAAKRASAKRVTAVIPYFGYARQDRKADPRTPISARVVSDLLTNAGAERVLCIDLHAAQIQGFFNVPVDHLHAQHIFVPYLVTKYSSHDNVVVVSPDVGGAARARKIAQRISASIAIVDKRRPKANVSEVCHVVGSVAGAHCILVDDIVDTAGSLCHAAKALKEQGATSVCACVTHPVLSDPAVERIEACDELDLLVVTDTIPLRQRSDKIKVLTCAEMLAEAIRAVHEEESLGGRFTSRWYARVPAPEEAPEME